MSASHRTRRGETFWSNSSFIGRQCCQPALAVGGEGETRLDVFSGQVGEVRENLLLSHPACEIFQNVRDRHARSAYAGLAAALARLDGDYLAVVHGPMIADSAPRSTLTLRGVATRL